MRKYRETHEWASRENGKTRVGISEHAQDILGEITIIDLPKVGRKVTAGEEVAVIESMKATSDIFTPLSGTIVEINSVLDTQPMLVNDRPLDRGWLFVVEESDSSEWDTLLEESQYIKSV